MSVFKRCVIVSFLAMVLCASVSCGRNKSKATAKKEEMVVHLIREILEPLGAAPSGGKIVLVISSGEFATFPKAFAAKFTRSATGWTVVTKQVPDDFMPDSGGHAFSRQDLLSWIPETERNTTALVTLVGLPAPSTDLSKVLNELKRVAVVPYISVNDPKAYPASVQWISMVPDEPLPTPPE